MKRIRAALATLEKRGWIGERLLGATRPFRVSIMEGAGAFICGEETALIASIEGRRGMPRLRPPFPAESGLGQADARQQRRDARAGAVDRAPRRRAVRRDRHREEQGHESVALAGTCAAAD